MAFILVAVGLLLILMEFYLPGVMIGIFGGIAILGGIIIYANSSPSMALFILFLLGTLAGIVFVVRFALWAIVKAKPENSIYSNQDQEGYRASTYDHLAIGKIGVVFADLKPGGIILVDGKEHSALSVSGYLSKGESVIVLSGQEQDLIVQKNRSELS